MDSGTASSSALVESPTVGEMVYMADTRLLPESVAQHNAIIDNLSEHHVDAAIKGLEKNWRFGTEVLVRKMGEE
jgi:hypothetical protein